MAEPSGFDEGPFDEGPFDEGPGVLPGLAGQPATMTLLTETFTIGAEITNEGWV